MSPRQIFLYAELYKLEAEERKQAQLEAQTANEFDKNKRKWNR